MSENGTIESVNIKLAPTLERMAADRASATPLPGPLANAFAHDGPIDIAGVSVRKIVAADWKVMTFLDSPLLRQLLEIAKPEDQRDNLSITDEEEWELVWQFTHSPKECRALMSKGREAFRNQAIDDCGDNYTVEQVRLVMTAIVEQMTRNSATGLAWASEAKEKGEITFFREPQPMTG